MPQNLGEEAFAGTNAEWKKMRGAQIANLVNYATAPVGAKKYAGGSLTGK